MSPGAVIAVVCWSAFAFWIVASVTRDVLRNRRMLRSRRPSAARNGIQTIAPPRRRGDL